MGIGFSIRRELSSPSAVSRNLLCNGKEKRKAMVEMRDFALFAIEYWQLAPN